MISFLRSTLKTLTERAAQREEQAKLDTMLTRYQREQADNLFVDDEDGRFLFDPYAFSTSDALDETQHLLLLRNCIRLYNTDGYVQGWVELFVRFVVGSECRLKSLDDDPATQECWNEYSRREVFSMRAQETARRYYREGEFFRRFFVKDINGDMTSRFLNPIFLRNGGQGESSFGIQTNPDDIEDVQGYWYDAARDGQYRMISADEVMHGKRADSDMKRGRPLITPVLAHIIELNKLLKARQFFHRIRASVIIEEKIKSATPAMIAAMAERERASSVANSKLQRGVPIGGIFRHSDGVEREYKTPNLQAVDADVDIRRQILKVAVALGIAEYMATGDASNANMASTMIAESPAVKTFSSEQTILGTYFEREHARVIQAKIDAGQLSPESTETVVKFSKGVKVVSTETVPRNIHAHVEFPDLIHRDPLAETNALILQATQGWISNRTAQIRLELDPDQEGEQIADEIHASDPMSDKGAGGAIDELNTLLTPPAAPQSLPAGQNQPIPPVMMPNAPQSYRSNGKKKHARVN